jgi:hypothetical protein
MKIVIFKKILRIATIMLIVLSSPAFSSDMFDIDYFNMASYKKQYNELTEDVEERRDALKKKINEENYSRFKAFRASAEELITRYNLQDYIGFRLIHRHFEVEENHVMSEQKNSGTGSLVTIAQDKEEAKASGAVPASWIFGKGGETHLFEVSNDPDVIEGNTLLKRAPSFITEIKELTLSYEMQDFLALAILKRQSLTASHHQVYIENNVLDENTKLGASIVTVGTIDPSQKAIFTTTSWGFSQNMEDLLESLWDKINCSRLIKSIEQAGSQDSGLIFKAGEDSSSVLSELTAMVIPNHGFRIEGITENVESLIFEDGKFKIMINGSFHLISDIYKRGFSKNALTSESLQEFLDNDGYFIVRQFTEGDYSIEAQMRLRGGACRRHQVCKGIKWGPLGIFKAHLTKIRHN